MTGHFLPLAWLLPARLLRWAESVIFGACWSEDEACEVAG